jgi:hypothetical protein
MQVARVARLLVALPVRAEQWGDIDPGMTTIARIVLDAMSTCASTTSPRGNGARRSRVMLSLTIDDHLIRVGRAGAAYHAGALRPAGDDPVLEHVVAHGIPAAPDAERGHQQCGHCKHEPAARRLRMAPELVELAGSHSWLTFDQSANFCRSRRMSWVLSMKVAKGRDRIRWRRHLFQDIFRVDRMVLTGDAT